MTEPKSPTDALDETERELARVLRALPGGDPPAALDQKILRAAANAAASSRRPRSRWLASVGSLWGIGGAAAAVLALGVTWQMIDPTRPGSAERTAPVPAAALSEDSAVTVDLGSAADTPAGKPSEFATQPQVAPTAPAQVRPAVRERAASVAPASEPAPAAMAAAPPVPPLAPAPFGEDRATSDRASAAPRPASVEAAKAQAAEQSGLLDAQESFARDRVARNQAGAAMAKAAPTDADAIPPTAWLASVRRLRNQGRPDEARESLRLFRQAYPKYAIPADLAPLLRE